MRNNPSIVYGLKARYYMLRLWLQIAMLAVKRTASAGQAFDLVKKINEMKNKLVDRRPIRKLVKADGKVFWNLNAPAWPSPAFDQYFLFTIDRLLAKKEVEGERVRFAMIAITKKCPLSCEHCFEWDEINKKEVLDLDTLKKIVAKYQRLGAAQFLLGGGEPLSRFHDLVELIKTAAPTSAFWITTSGFNITEQKARLLKQAGLSGMAISLDHFDKTKHNIFRGHSASYDFVKKAVEACHKTGLALSLSVCTTRNFVTMDNLMDYARLARDWGIGFIQLLEPRAVGRYKNQDVELSDEHYAILDRFYLMINEDKEYRHFPRIIHTSYNQRNRGCGGAGRYNVMIDTDGRINACPFCRSNGVFALDDQAIDGARKIQEAGCHKFQPRTRELNQVG